jgi:hypothetical protein
MTTYGMRLRKIQRPCRCFFAKKLSHPMRIPSQSMYSQVGSNVNIGNTLLSFNAVTRWEKGPNSPL